MKRLLSLIFLIGICHLGTFAETHVYALTNDPAYLQVFSMQSNGSLSSAQDLKIPERPMTIAVSNDKTLLYAGLRTEGQQGTLLTFRLNDSGGASLVDERGFDFQMRYLVQDARGKHLLFADYFGGRVGALELANGIPTGKVTSRVDTDRFAHGITISPDNKHVYVPHTQPNCVWHLTFNEQNGTLTKVASAPGPERDTEAYAPRHVKLHPNLPIVYTSNEHKGGISSWKIDAEGRIKLDQTLGSLPANFTGHSTAADVHMTPNGKFAYVSNRGGKGAASTSGVNTIAGFSIDSDGTLASIGFFEAATKPRSFTLTPDGNFLISAGQADKSLVTSKIATNGALEKIAVTKLRGKATWVISID